MSYIVRKIEQFTKSRMVYETILEVWVEYKNVRLFLYINDHLCINRDRLEQEVGKRSYSVISKSINCLNNSCN